MTTPDLRSGYSLGLIRLVEAADQSKVQVRFAKHCIANNISVEEVAAMFKVSRPAVYSWFKGVNTPSYVHTERMHDILGDPRPV